MTPEPWAVALARMFTPVARKWATPGELAIALDPKTRQTPALDLIDAELVRLLDTEDGRLIISLPPQEGKSTRVGKDFTTWALVHRPDTRIVVASYGDALARRNGRVIRDNLIGHPELGLRIREDVAAQGEWQVEGHDGGVYAAGIGTALTGRPADLMVIDDPIKDRTEADSATYRQRVWDWWTDVASTRLAPGAPVVVILTRWHEDDLAGRLLNAEDGYLWRVVNIPAQADTEDDPLGREIGQYLTSARGRNEAQWAAIKVRSGARTWASLYQGRPSPESGDILHREWWQTYEQPMWVDRDDGSKWVPLGGRDDIEIVQSWDMAFKDLASSDWVVGQVWYRRGSEAFLLDQVRGRWGFVETCNQLVRLSAKWPQALAKLVEDKANGTAVMNALQRRVPGMIPVEPEGSKTARAFAVSPLVEAGNVFLPSPELAPWVGDLIEEAAAFPNGSHDDQIDAATQALNRILLHPLMNGMTNTYTSDDEVDDFRIAAF